jgi:2-oxoglutarate dehydrogenase E2 component (dihydrolipoamide succinyltransferase)
MIQEVTVPEVGESITSGILTAWLKEDGELVQEGEDLFELETDKATLAVPSPFSGLLHIAVEADTEVEVGQAIASIDTDGAPAEAEKKPAMDESASSRVSQKLSPAVQRIVSEHGLDVSSIQGTGKDGRLTKADALQALDKAGNAAQEQAAGKPPKPRSKPQKDAAAASAAGPAQIPETPSTAERRQTRTPMTSIRKRIAERLVQAKQNAAHLTTFNEIDMLRVTEIRRRYRESFQNRHDIKLGFMSFFVKACCQALSAFPTVNATLDGDDVVAHNYVDMGIAVSTERGLIVPIIRDADKKSFPEIEREIAGFVVRAGEKKLTVDELTGGTFSITNGGVFGSLLSTPIPNPPQTAILGMHAIQQRPVVVDGEIVVRPMMYVALTYDHRLLDGREAVSFLVRVKELVEDPDALLLGL